LTRACRHRNGLRFSDIVAKVDGGFEAHLEGQGDEWGVFADFSWVSLGDDNDHMSSHTASDLDVHLVEAAAVWSPGEARNRGWELLAGLRHIDLDLGIDVDPANPTFDSVTIDVSQDFSDFMIGARYTRDWADRLGITLRGDGSSATPRAPGRRVSSDITGWDTAPGCSDTGT
jgi:hypothetical protein